MTGLNKITALPGFYYFESELPEMVDMIGEEITMFRRDPIVFNKNYLGAFFIDSILTDKNNFKYLEN